ncbi:MAG: quinone oxidoreductase [Phenylobacterium sp.]|uniref:quinone oxidoreductase family protein n=1 Tax=Phenylobacterium sp. TaxID=1871053 RepID=UPI001A4A21E7|nr:quinone oxidoreductase [Phenylobacterium sp.]MBL8553008.1 quinone oxidoreductase [Phenylobacterium sp.]
MRAVQFTRTGGPEVLEVVDVPLPEPRPGQARVRHEATGINFIDTYHRTGLYPVKLPCIPGGEAAGVVDAVGEGVTAVKIGDRVAYSGGFGAYAEANCVQDDRLVKLPEGIDARTAAAILLKGMTTEAFVCRTYPVRAGETVLVHAAVGGVGQIMTQWLKAIGAEVIATVGSDEKAARARALGADHVILYREQDVAAEVKRITGGKGVPVAYDSVGKDTFEGTLGSLARRGLFVSFGNASGPVAPFAPGRLAAGGSLYLTRPTLFDYVVTAEELAASAAAVFEMVLSGKIRIEIGQTFPLADARKAHEALEGRATVGASLLLP